MPRASAATAELQQAPVALVLNVLAMAGVIWVAGHLEHIEGSIRKLFFWLIPLGVPVFAMIPKMA